MPKKPKTFYILAERENHIAAWKIQRGDHNKKRIETERQLRRQQGAKATDLRILQTTDSQDDIANRIQRLNTV